MSLTLHVEGDRWRAHLREVVAARPGLVPVAKGNGYGFGNARLARRATWLGVDTLAVGTYAELDDVAGRFPGDLLVLTPWRPFLPGATQALERPDARRIIHTVSRLEDATELAASAPGARLVLERVTSMRRHGLTADALARAAREVAASTARLEGVALHLPLPGQHDPAEVESALDELAGLDQPVGQIWVSHLTATEVDALAVRHRELRFRPRVGTDLWLGDRAALQARATVLDAHSVRRGERFGYRQRPAPRAGTILVVSGGTAHGIGLEAPLGQLSVRSRAATLARGGLDAAGFARSPYTVAGKRRMFAEPPHMQCSMLFLPEGVTVPETGSEIDVRVRHTATTFDRVDIG